jgi:transcriptional regulator with XRE-family HTH domain
MARPRSHEFDPNDPALAKDPEARRAHRVKHKISMYVAFVRNHYHWTQLEFAARLGVSQAWVSMVENPNDPTPVPMTLLELVYEVTGIPYFLGPPELVRLELAQHDQRQAQHQQAESTQSRGRK